MRSVEEKVEKVGGNVDAEVIAAALTEAGLTLETEIIFNL